MNLDAAEVFVALGSNLGDPVTLVRDALHRLQTWAPSGFRASSLWRSTPVDCPPGSPDFINAVARFDAPPEATPESVLDRLQAWETESGRRPKQVLNEARPLDLDLLAFGDLIRRTPRLVLPHPRSHQRRFVLAPLVEIAPDLRLPGWDRTARDYLAALDTLEVLTRLAES